MPVRVRLPDAFRFDPDAAAADADPHRRRQADPGVRSRARWRARTARRELLRENLRQMARRQRPPRGARPRQRRRRDPDASLRRAQAAGRLHLRDRRAVRVAAAGVPRAADGVRRSRSCSCSRSSSSSSAPGCRRSLILLAAPLSLGGALLLLLAHRHRPERLVGDGADPAVGLVVKNGIMLLDFSEQLHAAGRAVRRRRSRTPAASGCGRS